MIDGKAVFSAITKEKHTEEDYESLVREYNDSVRSMLRTRADLLEILMENMILRDKLSKYEKQDSNKNWKGTGFFGNMKDEYK